MPLRYGVVTFPATNDASRRKWSARLWAAMEGSPAPPRLGPHHAAGPRRVRGLGNPSSFHHPVVQEPRAKLKLERRPDDQAPSG